MNRTGAISVRPSVCMSVHSWSGVVAFCKTHIMPLRNHTRGLFANWCVASWTSLWPLLLVLLLCFVVPFSILLSLDILHSPCCEARAEFVSVCVCLCYWQSDGQCLQWMWHLWIMQHFLIKNATAFKGLNVSAHCQNKKEQIRERGRNEVAWMPSLIHPHRLRHRWRVMLCRLFGCNYSSVQLCAPLLRLLRWLQRVIWC